MTAYPAYIFQGQYLLVNEQLELPLLAQSHHDIFLYDKNQTFIVQELTPHQHQVFTQQGFHLVDLRHLISYWTDAQNLILCKARQIFEWHKNHKFCSRCGAHTQQHTTEFSMVCPNCHYRQYPRIHPCVITIITHQDKILLAKAKRPNNDMYGLIAGFIEIGETIEQAVHREVMEEVGLSIKNLTYLASQPWPFPSNLMLAFHAEYDSGEIQLQKDEILDAQFFHFSQLPKIPFMGSIAYKMIQNSVHQLEQLYH